MKRQELIDKIADIINNYKHDGNFYSAVRYRYTDVFGAFIFKATRYYKNKVQVMPDGKVHVEVLPGKRNMHNEKTYKHLWIEEEGLEKIKELMVNNYEQIKEKL